MTLPWQPSQKTLLSLPKMVFWPNANLYNSAKKWQFSKLKIIFGGFLNVIHSTENHSTEN